MSNGTGKKAQNKSKMQNQKQQKKQNPVRQIQPEQKVPTGIQITQDQWNNIVAELNVFKKTVIDSVVNIVNANSTPLYAEEPVDEKGQADKK